MLKNGMILNTFVTAKDVERHKNVILNDPARLMAVITDKPKKHSDTAVVSSIGEKVNMDIVFDSYGG